MKAVPVAPSASASDLRDLVTSAMSLLLPKAPISAFFFFSQEQRAKVKANNPEMSFAEVAKHLGKMWKEMPEEDKAPYHKTAAQDKDRYARDVQAYWEIHGERPPTPAQVKRAKEEDASDAVSKKKRRSAAKDPNRVKRPTTAFFFFSSAKRQEVKEAGPELKTTEVAVKLGQMWKDLSEEERRPYMDLADADRKRLDNQVR